jgi:hypothetical protein
MAYDYESLFFNEPIFTSYIENNSISSGAIRLPPGLIATRAG